MKISLTLVHNKTQAENEAQIAALANLVTEQTELIDGVDDQGNIIPGMYQRKYYTINNLNIPHELEIQHIIPYQPWNTSNPYKAELPSNLYLLNGRNVQYGKGDEDKVGSHPRFFNWALKRGTDNGADISIYIEDITKISPVKARQALQKFTNNTEFVEADFGKLASFRLLKQVGQLKEDTTLTNAITDLKTRVVEKGLKNG